MTSSHNYKLLVRINVSSLSLTNQTPVFPLLDFFLSIYIYLAIIPSILYFHLFCTFSTSTCRHIEMLLNVARTKGRKIEARWMLAIYIIVHFPGDTWLEAGSFLKSLKHRRRIVTSCPYPRATIFRARFRRNRNEPAIVSCGRGRSLWVNIREYEGRGEAVGSISIACNYWFWNETWRGRERKF